jgi:hypothetical protein
MTNHFHLIIETPNANLVEGMRWLLSSYTLRLNRRHRLYGHVFSGRYKASSSTATPAPSSNAFPEPQPGQTKTAAPCSLDLEFDYNPHYLLTQHRTHVLLPP